MKPTTENDLRLWLEKRRRGPVTDEVWDELRAKSLVASCLQNPSDERLASLVQWADVLTRSQRPVQLRREQRLPDVKPLADELEVERARVYSTYLARIAERDPHVTWLRSTFFGGTALSEEETTRLLSSVATRAFPYTFFLEHDIPLLDHLATVKASDASRTTTNESEAPTQIIHIAWGDGLVHEEPVGPRFELRVMKEGLHFPLHPEGRRVLPGSVLDAIREVAQSLVRSYGWGERAAGRFLLTGEVPRVPVVGHPVHPPFGMSTEHAHCRIEMHIQPWASPRTVERAYRALQKRVYGSKRKLISRKNLALFEFVIENYMPGEVSWDELRKIWNSRHPGSSFKSFRAMRQEFFRYWKQVAFAGSSLTMMAKSHPAFLASSTTRAAKSNRQSRQSSAPVAPKSDHVR